MYGIIASVYYVVGYKGRSLPVIWLSTFSLIFGLFLFTKNWIIVWWLWRLLVSLSKQNSNYLQTAILWGVFFLSGCACIINIKNATEIHFCGEVIVTTIPIICSIIIGLVIHFFFIILWYKFWKTKK